MCQICDTHVNNRTKHCGDCNRCVAIFDHHCKWLNNCIGILNYKYFFSLVVVYLLHQLYLAAILSYMLSESLETKPWLIILACLFLDCVVKMIALGQLFLWHVWFTRHGITTFEYILE